LRHLPSAEGFYSPITRKAMAERVCYTEPEHCVKKQSLGSCS